jgi:hypothetical protein
MVARAAATYAGSPTPIAYSATTGQLFAARTATRGGPDGDSLARQLRSIVAVGQMDHSECTGTSCKEGVAAARARSVSIDNCSGGSGPGS